MESNINTQPESQQHSKQVTYARHDIIPQPREFYPKIFISIFTSITDLIHTTWGTQALSTLSTLHNLNSPHPSLCTSSDRQFPIIFPHVGRAQQLVDGSST